MTASNLAVSHGNCNLQSRVTNEGASLVRCPPAYSHAPLLFT